MSIWKKWLTHTTAKPFGQNWVCEKLWKLKKLFFFCKFLFYTTWSFLKTFIQTIICFQCFSDPISTTLSTLFAVALNILHPKLRAFSHVTDAFRVWHSVTVRHYPVTSSVANVHVRLTNNCEKNMNCAYCHHCQHIFEQFMTPKYSNHTIRTVMRFAKTCRLLPRKSQAKSDDVTRKVRMPSP